MATSEVEICNSSLQRIGQAPILSFDDELKRAKLCKLFYPAERNFLFRTYPWNFTTKRVTLARSIVVPDWGFAYNYPLPSDFRRLIEIQEERYKIYKIEGRSIVTNEETVKIKYSAVITSVSEFDDAFSEMLALRLAAVLAYPLTESNTLTQAMWVLYNQYEMDAFAADGQEGSPDAIEDTTLIDIRV